MMIYFESTTFVIPIIRRFWRLLLPLSCCALLFGCDSYSSSAESNNSATSQASDKVAIEPTNTTEEEGQSLIAAAKSDDNTMTRRSPMIAEGRTENTLQATLIGDYMGILPCSFCTGTAVTLNLFADSSVLKTSIYENPESPKVPLVESGVYRQDNNRITVVYDDKNIESYDIQDNHLVMIDENKEPDADYTLSRK